MTISVSRPSHRSARAARLAGLLALVAVLAGCTFLPPRDTPGTTHYLLELPKSPDAELDVTTSAQPPNDLHLYIEPMVANSFIDSRKILFRRDALTSGFYQFAGWVEPPTRRFVTLLLEKLERRRVVRSASRRPLTADLTLATEILAFHHDATTEPGAVVVEVRAELVDGRRSVLIDAKTFSSRVAVESFDAAGSVAAFGIAVDTVIDDMLAWLRHRSDGASGQEEPREAVGRG